jgi:adenylosuccinate lyase
MIERYTNPEMGRIWRDQHKYETWLQVEIAAADAMARAGIIPPTPRATSGSVATSTLHASRKSSKPRSMM